ncbi:MAG: AIM24 family protein [Roseobacter sp.]|jgi:uncharacterized protein (AIM24 family)|nr:AIM24 family protein [Roseobacter sp.]
MAKFEIHQMEGMRYVTAHLNDETIRAEAGALSYHTGDIEIHSALIPSVVGAVRSLLAEEAVYRPEYRGTGEVTLESSLGGFHILDLEDECWILEPGTYWASEGSVDVSFHRERMLTSFWTGEGLIYLQTRVNGSGKVVVTTRGPIEEVTLAPGQKLRAEGRYVVCRSESVSYAASRATRNFFGRFTSGEGLVRVFTGPGKLILNPAPYWRYKIFTEHGGDPHYPAKAIS